MPLLTDLRELKVELDIDPANSGEDKKLNFLIQIASEWIQEYLDRPGLFYAVRTEYYPGTNTTRLRLRSRPVRTTYVDSNNVTQNIQVFVDEGGFFGEAPPVQGVGPFDPTNSKLVYGQDFGLYLDQPDGTSRSGILFRINEVWPRPMNRAIGLLAPFVGPDFGSVKVTYGGGYLVDNLPAQLRYAVVLMVARMRQLLPIGFVLAGESYEERAIQYADPFGTGRGSTREVIMALAKPILFTFRNWTFAVLISVIALGMGA